MATLYAPPIQNLEIKDRAIDTKIMSNSSDDERAEAEVLLESLPENESFYQDEREASETTKKSGFLGRLGRSLSWNRLRAESRNEKEASAAVMACRSPLASQHGGVAIQDPNHAKLCRSVLALMIRQMGKNLLKGANVMNVSFPIQCCQPTTILEVASLQAGFFNRYLPRAATATDPVERLKLVVTAMVSAMILTSGNFLKPLNPILGETLQVIYEDGSKLFMEQTCHHPPVSSFDFAGPDNLYRYFGYTTFDIGFGYNKMHIKTSGLRVVEFPDGGCVTVGFPHDRWGNVFWGEMHHECLGSLEFFDERNGLRCLLRFGEGAKPLPSDYFEGSLERYDPAQPGAEPRTVCTVSGSWVGFVDFDKERYWDARSGQRMGMWGMPALLPSDSTFRSDRHFLASGDFAAAQAAKVELEEDQRRDRRLRQDALKVRRA